MGIYCDLEVDVNGKEIFFVDKKILASFSGRLSKLFGKLVSTNSHFKVIFHDFPGGAEGFELILRFCYENGKFEITSSNIFLLHSAAIFIEMNEKSSKLLDLIEQTDKYFDGIQCWTWTELLSSLKHCQDLLEFIDSSSVLHKFLDLFVERLALLSVTSPYTCSSENSISQISCDASSDSLRSCLSQTSWWFEDLVFLNINLLEKVIGAMLSQKFDQTMICSFLFYYQRSKLLGASTAQKRKIIGAVIDLLFLLDRSSISSKGLFKTFGLALCLKISKSCKNKLEALIGSKLDQATVDDLLIPSPRGKRYMYDVNLILRLLKSFLEENRCFPYRLKKVALAMDLYLTEVAPDPHLSPSKFVALAKSLPDLARNSQDRIYLAIDTYLKVHGNLCQEEKMSICSILNYNMLPKEDSIDLAKNSKFPPHTKVSARTTPQCKLKGLIRRSKHVRNLSDSPLCYTL